MTEHDHDHERTVAPMVDEITDFEVLEIALRELCIEKGIFTAEEHRLMTEFAEQIGPTPAAHLVAKAWLDPEFKKLALAEPMTASKEVGVDWMHPTGWGTPSDFTAFQILADTPTVHNVIVCALCSCYPRPILGNSPEWYRTPNYRRRLVRWPRQVLAEFGLYLPDEITVHVQDSNQKHRFMVMAMQPEGTEDWTEEQLVEIITRDVLIGVALPKAGVTTNMITDTRPAIHPGNRRMSEPIETLQEIVERNQVWPRMAAKWGVENPMPPWKTSLDGMCDALDHASCDADVPNFKDRRDEEDTLSATVYSSLPYPENQLVSLAHSLVARGIIDEAELKQRLARIRERLEA